LSELQEKHKAVSEEFEKLKEDSKRTEEINTANMNKLMDELKKAKEETMTAAVALTEQEKKCKELIEEVSSYKVQVPTYKLDMLFKYHNRSIHGRVSSVTS